LFRCMKRKMPRSVQRTVVPAVLAFGMQPHSCVVAFRPPYSTSSRSFYASVDHPQKQSIPSIKNNQLLLQAETSPARLRHCASLHVVLHSGGCSVCLKSFDHVTSLECPVELGIDGSVKALGLACKIANVRRSSEASCTCKKAHNDLR
jgi:hypothetical protein